MCFFFNELLPFLKAVLSERQSNSNLFHTDNIILRFISIYYSIKEFLTNLSQICIMIEEISSPLKILAVPPKVFTNTIEKT